MINLPLSYSIIFGLTADPIHKGHEQAIINGVHYLRENGFKVKDFILLPVFQPNLIAHKKSPVANFNQRFEMCELVANRLTELLDCKISVSKVEKHIAESTNKSNFTLNTLKYMNLNNCLFMISADHFQGRWPKFRKWFGWKEILKYSGLLINQRPGNTINLNFINQLKNINPNIFIVNNKPTVNISSSKIRADFKSFNSEAYLSKDIINYINNQKLY